MKRIDFSLSNGKIYHKSLLSICWIALVSGSLAIVVLFACMLAYEMTPSEKVGFGSLGFVVCFPIIFSAYHLIKQNKLKKKVDLWSKDAVELSASMKSQSSNVGMLLSKPTIIVEFSYQGKRYEKEIFNGKKKFMIVNQYINKKVKILYSPTYDEVLILKDDKISLA